MKFLIFIKQKFNTSFTKNVTIISFNVLLTNKRNIKNNILRDSSLLFIDSFPRAISNIKDYTLVKLKMVLLEVFCFTYVYC